MTPSPCIERTCTGMALQALISFWALHALPMRTAQPAPSYRQEVKHYVQSF